MGDPDRDRGLRLLMETNHENDPGHKRSGKMLFQIIIQIFGEEMSGDIFVFRSGSSKTHTI